MAPSGATHPLDGAYLAIRPPTRAFYDEGDTGKGSSGKWSAAEGGRSCDPPGHDAPAAGATGQPLRVRCRATAARRMGALEKCSPTTLPGCCARAGRLLRRALPAALEELAHSGRTLHRRRHDVLAYFDHNASNGRPHRSHQRPATQILCYGHELSVLPARYLDDVAVELKNYSQTRPNRSLLHLPRETAHDYPNLGCLSPASMSMSSMSDW
jgi:hypothetical protein